MLIIILWCLLHDTFCIGNFKSYKQTEAKNRMLAYENANKILKAVHLYMLVNKLHINMSKCCFIDFKPDKNVIPDSNLCLKINNVVIKQVNEARFLGVTLDENLNWKSHIHKLSKKLSCSAGILNLIKYSIPEDLYKSFFLPFLRATYLMVSLFGVVCLTTNLNRSLNSRKNA